MWKSRRQRYRTSSQTSPLENDPHVKPRNKMGGGSSTTTILWAQTALGTDANAPFVEDKGPKRGM